jgi:hypothetical protein
MIVKAACFDYLDCNKLKIIKRKKRTILNKSSQIFPRIEHFDTHKLSRPSGHSSLNDEFVEVLKCESQKTFVSHSLNALAQLPECAQRIVLCDDENIAISGVNELATLGESSLRVVVRTKKGFDEFPLPFGLVENIVIDIDKKPRDAWERNISKGASGIPAHIDDDVGAASDPITALAGSVTPLHARKSNKFSTTKRVRFDSDDDLQWVGVWSSIPSAQRSAYKNDLERAIALGHQLSRSITGGDEVMFQGMPVTLIRDALSANWGREGKLHQSGHRYGGTMPHDRNKRIPSMKVKKFRKWYSKEK